MPTAFFKKQPAASSVNKVTPNSLALDEVLEFYNQAEKATMKQANDTMKANRGQGLLETLSDSNNVLER